MEKSSSSIERLYYATGSIIHAIFSFFFQILWMGFQATLGWILTKIDIIPNVDPIDGHIVQAKKDEGFGEDLVAKGSRLSISDLFVVFFKKNRKFVGIWNEFII